MPAEGRVRPVHRAGRVQGRAEIAGGQARPTLLAGVVLALRPWRAGAVGLARRQASISPRVPGGQARPALLAERAPSPRLARTAGLARRRRARPEFPAGKRCRPSSPPSSALRISGGQVRPA